MKQIMSNAKYERAEKLDTVLTETAFLSKHMFLYER